MAKGDGPNLAQDLRAGQTTDLSDLDFSTGQESADLAAEGLSVTSISRPKGFAKKRHQPEINTDVQKVKGGPCLDSFVSTEPATEQKVSKENKVQVKSEHTAVSYRVSLGSGTLLDRVITWLAVQLRNLIDRLLAAVGMDMNKRSQQEEEEESEEVSTVVAPEDKLKSEWSSLVENPDPKPEVDVAYSRSASE